jgi:hypothetical protein
MTSSVVVDADWLLHAPTRSCSWTTPPLDTRLPNAPALDKNKVLV